MTRRFVITADNIRRKPLTTRETVQKYGLTKADVAAVEAFVEQETAPKPGRESMASRGRPNSAHTVKFKRHTRQRSSSGHK